MKMTQLLWIAFASGSVLMAATPACIGQLAITEVLSSGSVSLGPNVVAQRPDFWELTNFGEESIDLTGLRFSDSTGLTSVFESEDQLLFTGLRLEGKRSMIFFQTITNVCTNASQFRAWWGDQRIPADVQILPYTRRGFGGKGDAVQVWRVDESGTNVVDQVQLPEARAGYSFTYDPATGFLDTLSEAGLNHAFKAAETDDVGSPGASAAGVAVGFLVQPQNLTVDAGAPAVLSTRVIGLPRARLQWHHEGLDIPGETTETLTLSNAEPHQAGRYGVRISNGLTEAASQVAVLEVNTIPTPPSIFTPPHDVDVSPTQTAVFRVAVCGYPLPGFRWLFQGQEIPGQTASVLRVENADDLASGLYSVVVSNNLGVVTASALLSVSPPPKLFITEMMGSRSTNSTVVGRSDWWELTNFDTRAVNLRGYRFDDYPRVLTGSWVITNDLVIRPGESVVFLQNMTPQFFTEWWGEENLPADLQFVRYTGNGINAQFDLIALWNSTASDADDFVARSEYVHLDQNSFPIQGSSLSFWCDGRIEEGKESRVGECGAVRAAKSADVASPGYYTNHPPRVVAPRLVAMVHAEGVLQLTYTSQAGTAYEWLTTPDIGAGEWTVTSRQIAAGDQIEFKESIARGSSWRFYSVRVATSSP